MSQYSETVGSFIRTGNYPLEANYIFDTYNDLVTFYQDPINQTTLHIGLFRVVNEDPQSLYWVTTSNGTLQFIKLIDNESLQSLSEQINQVNSQLIEEAAKRNQIIYGDLDSLPSDLNSLIKIASAINQLMQNSNLLERYIKSLVGTEEDDILSYLQSLPISNITDLINTVQEILNKNEDLQSLINKIQSDLNLKLSSLWDELNNTQTGVGLDSSGLYSPDQETNYLKSSTSVMNALKTLDSLLHNVSLSYANGIISLLVNNQVVSSQNINLDAIIQSVTYDREANTIYITFKLHSGELENVEIPLQGIIKNISVQNDAESAVILALEEQQDSTILSANVNISNNELNALKNINGELSVLVTTDIVTHNDQNLYELINTFEWYEGE